MKKGSKMTLEQRQMLSEAHKGQISWRKGKHIQTNTGRTHFKKGQIAWSKGKKLGKNPKHSKFMKEYYKTHSAPMKGKKLGFIPKYAFKKGNIPWIKGKHLSEETKRKLRIALRGRLSPMKGKHQTENAKRKLSIALKGKFTGKDNPFYGKHHTEEAIRKLKENWMNRFLSNPEMRIRMSEAHKGKRHSEEWKRKLREIAKINPNYGMKGKRHSEAAKRKIGETHRREKSFFWKGGISFEPYGLEWTRELKRIIRKRDNYTCQICHKAGNVVHHIDYNKTNCNPENLITLCHNCHAKTNINREKWKSFFKNLRPQPNE